MRLVRALEVYLLTHRPLTAHFSETSSPIADFATVTIGLRLPRSVLLDRVTARVDQQFRLGLADEVERLLATGVPPSAHAFSGLVYRQVMEMRAGRRDDQATRDLIIRENMRYARRQLMWFRREEPVHWIEAPGESAETQTAVLELVTRWIGGSSSGVERQIE
jgi:tRNA dimethylallyltransferase